MKPPRKIYLQWYGDESPKDCDDKGDFDGVTWCRDRIFKHDVVYVRPRPAKRAKGRK